MPKSIFKLILVILIFLAASKQIPALHKTAKTLFAKRAYKGHSSLERFNDQLWKNPKK
ncbi:hypothetical protein K2X05_04060 [bacterium]|nr:hypothetical protein [bacterium]